MSAFIFIIVVTLLFVCIDKIVSKSKSASLAIFSLAFPVIWISFSIILFIAEKILPDNLGGKGLFPIQYDIAGLILMYLMFFFWVPIVISIILAILSLITKSEKKLYALWGIGLDSLIIMFIGTWLVLLGR